MANDKPKIEFTLDALVEEVAKEDSGVEPLQFSIGGKRVTFKNPTDVGFVTLAGLVNPEGGMDLAGMVRDLMSEEDYAHLERANPSSKVIMKILERANAHYAIATGGEDSKS